MAFVYWIFFMDFNEMITIIINQLGKPRCIFFRVHLFDVSGMPTCMPRNVIPVSSPTIRQCFPAFKFPFILTPFLFFCQHAVYSNSSCGISGTMM